MQAYLLLTIHGEPSSGQALLRQQQQQQRIHPEKSYLGHATEKYVLDWEISDK